MHQAAEEQKKQFGLKVDQQVKMQEMDLDQQFLQVLQYVKQQATRQRAILEQQAMQLSFEYQEKKVEEDMLAHQFELSKHQQALKNQMYANGPLSPLPSYKPVSSTTVAAGVAQVPASPFAANRLQAFANDAIAPVLTYAPLGDRGAGIITPGFSASSYVPPVVSAGPPVTMAASYLPPWATVTALPPTTVISPQPSYAALPTVATVAVA
jgi:hypothetical protein